jgi:hypothetical protein
MAQFENVRAGFDVPDTGRRQGNDAVAVSFAGFASGGSLTLRIATSGTRGSVAVPVIVRVAAAPAARLSIRHNPVERLYVP